MGLGMRSRKPDTGFAVLLVIGLTFLIFGICIIMTFGLRLLFALPVIVGGYFLVWAFNVFGGDDKFN